MYQKAYPPTIFRLLCSLLALFNTPHKANSKATTALPSIYVGIGYGRLIFNSILLPQPIIFIIFVAVIIIAS
ncbi:hypothetical protein HMPREF2140_07175 [Hoylesella buccalis DNF00985]|nr:hypothetical protein HMPREF2140_07175 [Hoylesella buccalis DNF00985]